MYLICTKNTISEAYGAVLEHDGVLEHDDSTRYVSSTNPLRAPAPL